MTMEEMIARQVEAKLAPALSRLEDLLKQIVAQATPAEKTGGAVLLTVGETQAHTGYTRTRFYEIRRGAVAGLPPFPSAVKVGTRDMYVRAEVDAWLAQLPRVKKPN